MRHVPPYRRDDAAWARRAFDQAWRGGDLATAACHAASLATLGHRQELVLRLVELEAMLPDDLYRPRFAYASPADAATARAMSWLAAALTPHDRREARERDRFLQRAAETWWAAHTRPAWRNGARWMHRTAVLETWLHPVGNDDKAASMSPDARRVPLTPLAPCPCLDDHARRRWRAWGVSVHAELQPGRCSSCAPCVGFPPGYEIPPEETPGDCWLCDDTTVCPACRGTRSSRRALAVHTAFDALEEAVHALGEGSVELVHLDVESGQAWSYGGQLEALHCGADLDLAAVAHAGGRVEDLLEALGAVDYSPLPARRQVDPQTAALSLLDAIARGAPHDEPLPDTLWPAIQALQTTLLDAARRDVPPRWTIATRWTRQALDGGFALQLGDRELVLVTYVHAEPLARPD